MGGEVVFFLVTRELSSSLYSKGNTNTNKNDVEYFKNGMPTPTGISFFEMSHDFVHSVNVT